MNEEIRDIEREIENHERDEQEEREDEINIGVDIANEEDNNK